MKKLYLFFFIFIGLISVIFCQTESATIKSKRPTVGLVLSGGGAKGWAYIGLLKVIQEAGLRIDYIGGTSAGSIIGGLYAIGYHPDSIAKIIRTQKWNELMQDVQERKYISYFDKVFGERYIFTLPVKEKKIGLKASLYEGQNIDLMLNHYFTVVYKIKDFSKLLTPFICIGTDLITGDAVVLNKGYLPQAIKTSMSIPGYFAPIDYEGYYMVDGGVVNNYPVMPVKELGAQIIIGGDVQSGDTTNREDLNTLTNILDQIIGYHRNAANEIGRQNTDLYVHLKSAFTTMDFDKYDSIIAFGERTARKYYDQIKALADSLNAIEYRPVKKYETVPLDSVYINDIRYTGYNKMRPKYLDNYFGKFKNKYVRLEEIEDAVNYLYGTQFFQTVFYELQYENGRTILLIKLKESDPGNLSAGIHYDTEYQGSVLANMTVRNVLGRRSKLFIDLLLGTYPRLRALYLIDNGAKPGLGINLDFYGFNFDIYDGTAKENRLEFDNYEGSVFVPLTIRNNINFKAGFDYQYFRFRQKIIIDSTLDYFSEFSSYGNLFFSLGVDTRDKAYFTTRGVLSELKVKYILPFSKNLSSVLFTNTLISYFNYNQNIPLTKRFTLKPGLFLGYTLQDRAPPIQHWFWIGGLNEYNYLENHQAFSGLKFIQSYGLYTAIGRLKLQYNFIKKFYATLMTDVGQNQISFDDFLNMKNIMVGYGLKVSFNSFIGPVEFAVMGSNMLPGASVFFSVGYWL